jgi:hypothetical protein
VLTRFSRQLALAALCLLAVSAAAQTTSKITLDSSETIFSVVAAMRNCGYDAGSTDPFRAQVSREIAQAGLQPNYFHSAEGMPAAACGGAQTIKSFSRTASLRRVPTLCPSDSIAR